jgi:hypothetical protein
MRKLEVNNKVPTTNIENNEKCAKTPYKRRITFITITV